MPDVEVTPSSSSTTTTSRNPIAWIWEHRRSIAPFVGVAMAILCPHLGPVASGPCKLVGQVVRTWSFDGQSLP